MKDSPFFEQARAMLNILPFALREECFALKGGTAINFFVRDMPRLSVDIDLTYLPVQDRETSLREIGAALERVGQAIRKALPDSKVTEVKQKYTTHTTKLDVVAFGQPIRIEPNPTLRGAATGVENRPLVARCAKEFALSVDARTLSFADLYGGKLCAALDRQHPRDLFDVRLLLAAEGITDEVRRAFVVYLVSSDRPISELIDPTRKDVKAVFDSEFATMTAEPVSYADLVATREQMITAIQKTFTDSERRFLVSIKEGDPKWELMNLPGIERLPSIQWKLINVRKMTAKKRKDALERLKAKIGV